MNGCRVGVIHSETLLHGPSKGAVVDNNVFSVFHVEARVTRIGYISGPEANMPYDDVVLAHVNICSCDTDASSGCSLSCDSDVGVFELEFAIEEDCSADLEQDGSRRVVSGAQRPAECSFHKVLVSAVVKACHVIYVTAPAAGGVFAPALSLGEGECLGIYIAEEKCRPKKSE